MQVWTLAHGVDTSENGTIAESLLTSPGNMKQYYALYHLMCALHLATGVFWLPTVVIVVSYMSLSIWLVQTGRGGAPARSKDARSSSCYSNVTTMYAPTATETTPSAWHYRRPLPVITVNPCADGDAVPTVVTVPAVNTTEVVTVVSTARHMARAKSSAIRVTFLLVAAYIVCWLPYSLLLIWEFFSPTTYEFMSYWLNGLIVLNSCVNPYLYGTFGTIHKFARNA